ncbi:MAG: hypothetical protein K0S47_1606 [Herbinix sp.]|jgi:S1-C subfamily serine protease|nr:hypothetical protein [Herbinix sp.]
MSENDKDKDFEFIKEQIIEKKHKKLKKLLFPFLMTSVMAILFGVIAAATFCLTEPRMYELFHNKEESKTPVEFPDDEDKQNGDNQTVNTNPEVTPTQKPECDPELSEEEEDLPEVTPSPVIVEQSIDADIDDYNSIMTEVRKVASEVNKSLVKVSCIVNGTDSWFNEPIETIVETTGLIIPDNNVDLLILVSLDRVKNASSIQIDLTDKVSVDAVLQDYETDLNLGVLAVSLEDIPESFQNNLSVATFGESYSITIGYPVLALGSPNGYPFSMDFGLISSKGSKIGLVDNQIDLFNTNMQENENSDGVIVNLRGEVIGLITRTLREDMNKELSTAIGISKLKDIIKRMANQTPRVYFGVKAEDMTDDAKQSHEVTNGIYINDVEANSPAFTAGLKSGDIVMEINEQVISTTNNFNTIISNYVPGDELKVMIKRTTNEKEMEVVVVLEEKAK